MDFGSLAMCFRVQHCTSQTLQGNNDAHTTVHEMSALLLCSM